MIEKFKTLFYVKSSLISLYLALTIPLPFISIEELKIPSIIIFALGLYLIINITSDYVETCSNKISYKTTFVSIPTLLDSSSAPEGKHIVHAFTPSSMSEWEGLSRKEYLKKKEKYFSFLVEKISTILPNLEQNIDHKEIGTPKTHKKFLGRYEGSYGPIPSKKLLGLLPMPFNTTKIQNLYCVGDSCFPGQGLNAVAFSGYACAHKIGAKLNINSFKLPD